MTLADLKKKLSRVTRGAPLSPRHAQYLQQAFGSVNFGVENILRDASALTPEQLALARWVTERDFEVHPLQMPRHKAVRRTWLGLDAPGLLEQRIRFRAQHEPIWRATRMVEAKDKRAFLRRFTIAERLQLFGEVNACGEAYGIANDFFVDEKLLSKLTDEGKTWAPAFASYLVQHWPKTGYDKYTNARLVPVFLALVRASIRIKAQWDKLLPLDHDSKRLVQYLKAIPRKRREAAILFAVKRTEKEHPAYALLFAQTLLKQWPSVAVVDALLRGVAFSSRSVRVELDQLRAWSKGHPRVIARINAYEAKRGPRLDLWRTHVVARPKSLAQLGPLTQLQLAIAGARYDGNKLSAQDRLFEANGKPTLFQMFFESSVLVDQHGIAHYDVIRFMVDDALIFKSNTTELVGSMVQFGVNGMSLANKDAIEFALICRPADNLKSSARRPSHLRR